MRRTVMRRTTLAGAVLAVLAAGAAATDPLNPYGACAHVTGDEPAVRTCALLREAGVGWVRSGFRWDAAERKPGEWDFAAFDKVVDDCEAQGVQLLPILCRSVAWADPAHEHLDAWGDYVKRVVTRYGTRLPVLEVWNEQNISMFWKNPSAANYLALLRRTYEVVKAHDPALRVSFGGTSGIPHDFFEEVYKLGGGKFFDLVSVHPYTHPEAPEGRLDRDLEKLRAIMAKYGDAEKPIWITEMGWPTPEALMDDKVAALLRAGLRTADAAKAAWRVLYVPSCADFGHGESVVAALREALPPGSTAEACAGTKLAARLAAGDVDAIVLPFDQTYCADGMDAAVDFVKAGGTLVDFGGMPLWRAFRTDATGRLSEAGLGPGRRDRARLRIQEQAWWTDRRYPKELRVAPVGEAAAERALTGAKRGLTAMRFVAPTQLKPGDELVPLLAARTNGIEAVASGVYRFDSDFKGRVVLSGLIKSAVASVSESRQAQLYARALGIAFAEGVEAFFNYELRDAESSPRDPECYYGIVRRNFAPKPAFSAYWTFIDRRPAGSVQRPGRWRDAKGVRYFPQWKRPDGRDAGMVWTTGEPEEAWLTFTGGKVAFHDHLGKRVLPVRDGRKFRVPLSGSPVYFTGAALVVD